MNEAKASASLANIIGFSLGIIITFNAIKPLVKRFGELRMIIVTQFITYIQDLILFLPDPPVDKWHLSLTYFVMTINASLCDSLFLS